MRTFFNTFYDKISDAIYVTGGQSTTKDFRQLKLKSAQMFDIKTEKWSDMPDMIKPRNGHAVFRNSDYIYAFGGAQQSVERLNLHEMEMWELLII